MGKVNLEIDTVELQYAMNSLAHVLEFMDRYAEKDAKYYVRRSSIESLKDQIKHTLKEQADIEDLREGMKIIKS